jgi:Calcineurin-like phosphoesterase
LQLLRSRRVVVVGMALIVLAVAVVGILVARRRGGLPQAQREMSVLAVGDIGDCETRSDEAVARLVGGLPGTIVTLGDNAYEEGSRSDFRKCFDPAWGRHRPRIRPAPGNHDYGTPDAAGYFAYFGPAAGDPGRGWYSFDLGPDWHLIALNSECEHVGGCDEDSPQLRWLEADLAAHADKNVLAYWHHPRFSSGVHGSDEDVDAFWQALYEAGADIVLNGHDHDYERFAPQDPDGRVDPERGIRQFVVGTGGTKLRPFKEPPLSTTEMRDDSSHGVLKLTLRRDSYDWEFVSTASFTDTGTTRTQ